MFFCQCFVYPSPQLVPHDKWLWMKTATYIQSHIGHLAIGHVNKSVSSKSEALSTRALWGPILGTRIQIICSQTVPQLNWSISMEFFSHILCESFSSYTDSFCHFAYALEKGSECLLIMLAALTLPLSTSVSMKCTCQSVKKMFPIKHLLGCWHFIYRQ